MKYETKMCVCIRIRGWVGSRGCGEGSGGKSGLGRVDTREDQTPKNRGRGSKVAPLRVRLCTGQLQRVPFTKPAQPLGWGMLVREGCWSKGQLLSAQGAGPPSTA